MGSETLFHSPQDFGGASPRGGQVHSEEGSEPRDPDFSLSFFGLFLFHELEFPTYDFIWNKDSTDTEV